MDRDRVRENVTEKTARARSRPRYTNTNSSEAIERNEAGGPFSTACYRMILTAPCSLSASRSRTAFRCMDLQLSVHPFQSVLVPTDIGTRFPHAETIDDKRGSHDDGAVFYFDSYIGNEVPGARRRIFSVTVAALQSFHASAQPHHVVVDKNQVLPGISVREIRGRDQISAVGGEKRQPLIQPPGVQKSRLLVKKLLHRLAQSGCAAMVSGGACFRHDCFRC